VVAPRCLGGCREERGVERAAESLGRFSRGTERCSQHLHPPAQRPCGPQRRARSVGLTELLQHTPHRVGRGRAGRRNSGGVGQEVLDLLQQCDGDAQTAVEQLVQQVGLHHLGCCGGFGRGDEFGVERRRLFRISREVEELQRQLHAALTVDDGVVHLLHQGALATSESVDHDELPQRTSAVERVGRDQAGVVEQLPHRAGLGQRHVTHVGANVEVGVVDPHRRGEVHRCRLDTLVQTRHRVDGTFHPTQQPFEVGSAIEQCDVGERGAEVWVLLQTPHQPFCIAHLPVEMRQLSHESRGYPVPGQASAASAARAT
jgi:hypothetical protein